jgi:hypothetical protein
MSLFLQILGVIFLLIIAYVAFRVLLLVGKAALVLYGVKKLVSQVEAVTPLATIRLLPVLGAKWDNADAEALAAGLPGLGYQEVGFFDLDLMGGLRLQAWVHSDSGLYAVVYSAPQAGIWSDVVTKYEDGTSLTYSNSVHGGKLKQRPGRENVYFKGLGTDELHGKMLAERPVRPTRRLTAADFAPDFERAYAEEMAWRASPEGFDPATVTPGAALAGMIKGKFTPDQMRQVRESMVRNMYEVVAKDLRPRYRASAALTDDEWARIEPRLVFVWDTMNVESLRAVLAEWDGLPERERLDNFLGDDPETGDEDEDEDDDEQDFGHVRRSFAELNAVVPTDRRLVKIGEVPLEVFEGQSQAADVYERPAATTAHGIAGPALS